MREELSGHCRQITNEEWLLFRHLMRFIGSHATVIYRGMLAFLEIRTIDTPQSVLSYTSAVKCVQHRLREMYLVWAVRWCRAILTRVYHGVFCCFRFRPTRRTYVPVKQLIIDNALWVGVGNTPRTVLDSRRWE